MSLIVLAAVGLDNSIGRNSELLWHLPEDLKHYKNLTTGKKLVVGKNTFNGLPEKAKLNRFHCVISSGEIDDCCDHMCFKTIEEFFDYYKNLDEDVYVIGGQQVFDQLVEHCNKAIITTVCDFYPEADKFFPMYHISTGFTETKSTGKLKSVSGLEYIIRVYDKNK